MQGEGSIGLRYKQEDGSRFKIYMEKDQCLRYIQGEESIGLRYTRRRIIWFKINKEKDHLV